MVKSLPYRKPFVYILYDFRVIKLTRVGSFKKKLPNAKRKSKVSSDSFLESYYAFSTENLTLFSYRTTFLPPKAHINYKKVNFRENLYEISLTIDFFINITNFKIISWEEIHHMRNIYNLETATLTSAFGFSNSTG